MNSYDIALGYSHVLASSLSTLASGVNRIDMSDDSYVTLGIVNAAHQVMMSDDAHINYPYVILPETKQDLLHFHIFISLRGRKRTIKSSAMVNSGTTSLFISDKFVARQCMLKELLLRKIILYNIDGALNKAGTIEDKCHDQPKNFIFPGPLGGTTLVPYPTVTPTVLGISTPQNSITTLGVQLICTSLTPAPASPIKEQPTFTIAAPQPSHLIIPPDVATIRHPIRNPLPLQVDQYISSPSPPIPDQAVFLGGDNDTTMSSPQQFPLDHLPFYYQGWEVTSPEYTL